MYAQCPECLTLYEVDAATLAQANGAVGCGQCGTTFNALTTLVESLPAGSFRHLPVHAASPAPPILMMAASLPVANDDKQAPTPAAQAHEPPDDRHASRRRDADLLADFMACLQAGPPDTDDSDHDAAPDSATRALVRHTDDSDHDAAAAAHHGAQPRIPALYRIDATPGDDTDTAAAHDVLADDTPDLSATDADGIETDDDTAPPIPAFARPRRHAPARPGHTWRWIAGCAVLLLCLSVQVAWAERQNLAANPSTRPWLTQLCGWLGCQLPTVSDLSDLELLSRDVRPHPTVPGALLISATVRNNATFAQPYPVVSITLSDLDENRIAMRRFRPDRYIPDRDVRAAGLAPGATTALMFEVRDPGRNAIAFEFAFQ